MPKRLFDIVVAALLLLVLLPVFVLTSLAILVSDPGPILYRAQRIGKHGVPFVMHKFRSMYKDASRGSAITGGNDPRVFPFGRVMRKLKLDELPQFWDVLRGKMSIVGPRPEDPGVVERVYTDAYRKTFAVRPGLTSPGSIYYYAHAEDTIEHDDAEQDYARNVLPTKIALDLLYVENVSLGYDLRIIGRTMLIVVAMLFGRRHFPLPPEYEIAEQKGYLDA